MVFFILLLCISTVVTIAVAADDITLSISMLEGEQQTRFNKPVFVAGVWHYVNISTDQNIDKVSLIFYKGPTRN